MAITGAETIRLTGLNRATVYGMRANRNWPDPDYIPPFTTRGRKKIGGE